MTERHELKPNKTAFAFYPIMIHGVVLLFLIYPSVWKQILVVFSCFTVDEEHGTLPKLEVMQADVGVDCASEAHHTAQTYAIITGIVIMVQSMQLMNF